MTTNDSPASVKPVYDRVGVDRVAMFLNRHFGAEMSPTYGRTNWRHLKADDKQAWRNDAVALLDFLATHGYLRDEAL